MNTTHELLVARLQDEADQGRQDGADDLAALLDEAAAALSYYRAAAQKERPEYLPKTIVLPRTVRADPPFQEMHALPGLYAAECTRWGVVSVLANNDHLLGVKLSEFEVTAWARNTK